MASQSAPLAPIFRVLKVAQVTALHPALPKTTRASLPLCTTDGRGVTFWPSLNSTTKISSSKVTLGFLAWTRCHVPLTRCTSTTQNLLTQAIWESALWRMLSTWTIILRTSLDQISQTRCPSAKRFRTPSPRARTLTNILPPTIAPMESKRYLIFTWRKNTNKRLYSLLLGS